ncbi:restriction endonuclease subunit S [Staphylococcus cohnii]|uniref:restriction endonuclease subunit S n=1 Tax=Staphylococcus cohnii TaxID=29382 RepID=UPI00384B63BB
MEYKLGEICTFQEGYVNPSQKVAKYFDGPHKWVRAVDVNNNEIFNTSRTLSEEGFESAKKSAYKFPTNSIVMTKSGTIGRVAIIKDKMAGNRATINIVPNEKNVSLYYLFYLLITKRHDLENLAVGSVQKNLYISVLSNVKINIPELRKQYKIAEILKNIDDIIMSNNKIIANLEELSQTLFKRWFVDFEFPDENGNPYKSSGGEMVDSELGEIPINWNLVKLGSIANIRTGYAFKSTEYIEQIQLPVLRTLNISKSNLLVTMNDIKFVPYQYLYMDKYQKYNLELFDTLLVTVGGSIGNLGLVTENNLPSLQNQNMWRFRSIKSNISNTLIYQLILYVNSLVYNQTSGSAREFYTKKTFENFNLLLPKLDSYLYESINKYLENFGKKISDLNVEIEKLTQLRDTLLPKLMSGEIEIPDHIEVNEDELSI